MRAKHPVNYAFQTTRNVEPRMAHVYVKPITRRVTNIAVKTNETILFQVVLFCK